jgi:hypothetical protein
MPHGHRHAVGAWPGLENRPDSHNIHQNRAPMTVGKRYKRVQNGMKRDETVW